MSKAADLARTASASETALSNRNVFINGNFDVWQRSTSYTDVAGIWKYGFADRWNAHNDGADAGTFSRSTTVPDGGSTYSLLMTGASSVTNTNLNQKVESSGLQSIRQANSYTVSGWLMSEVAGKVINLSANIPTNLDNHSGYNTVPLSTSATITGNGVVNSVAQITLTSASTWYYFTATHSNPNGITNFANGFALFLSFVGQTSTTHKVYLAQVQMESGPVATPFEHRSYGQELALCSRYYTDIVRADNKTAHLIGYVQTSTVARFGFHIPMRTSPSITETNFNILYGGGSEQAITSIDDISQDNQFLSFRAIVAANLTSGQAVALHSDGAATLTFDAEL